MPGLPTAIPRPFSARRCAGLVQHRRVESSVGVGRPTLAPPGGSCFTCRLMSSAHERFRELFGRRPVIVLAPMEDVSDAVFRRVCRDHGAELCVTEFVHAPSLVEHQRKALRKIALAPDDAPTAVQIYGADAAQLAAAAQAGNVVPLRPASPLSSGPAPGQGTPSASTTAGLNALAPQLPTAGGPSGGY